MSSTTASSELEVVSLGLEDQPASVASETVAMPRRSEPRMMRVALAPPERLDLKPAIVARADGSSGKMDSLTLENVVPDSIWVKEYPVQAGGARFNARMSVIKLGSGQIIVHSPSAFDDALAAEIRALGPVAAIVAPGNLHWLHVRSCQEAFPGVPTYICPGTDERSRELRFDFVLGDEAPALWAADLAQVALCGTRLMREVAFFHRASRTLLLVDLVENFTPTTPGTNLWLRVIFRALGMWNRASPAPEYRFGWSDKAAVRACLERVLAWDFERVILSHGDLIMEDARPVVVDAWRSVLGWSGTRVT